MGDSILLITNREDLASDFLICRLLDLGISYYRLNSDDLHASEFEFTTCGSSFGYIQTAGNKIALRDISGVFYRRKIYPSTAKELNSNQKDFVAGELQHLVEGMVWNPNITWVNSMEAVTLAERKPYQLQVAKNIGLQVPKTLITNSPPLLNTFFSSIKSVICKPIFHGRFEDSAVYTRRISKEELWNYSQLKVCPVFLQEEIKKGSDIRLTIVGDEVFSVEISSEGEPLLDWRIPDAKLNQSVCDMPEELIVKCKNLLGILGLAYGAFDFVKSKEGDYYFLEVNAAGEWAWLEVELGLSIRDSFIKLLTSHK